MLSKSKASKPRGDVVVQTDERKRASSREPLRAGSANKGHVVKPVRGGTRSASPSHLFGDMSSPLMPIEEKRAPIRPVLTGSLSEVSFLVRDPKPRGQPLSRRSPVRVLVAANGYIDASFMHGSSKSGSGKSPRSSPSADKDSGYISCTDNFVQLSTTYTDCKRFMFDKVFGSTDPTDGMFNEVLPTVMDVVNGINGHVIVSASKVLLLQL